MVILRSNFIGSPIVDLRTQTKFGTISDLIFDDSTSSIVGLALKNGFNNIKIVIPAEVLEFSNKTLVINDEDAITDLKDNLRIDKLVQNHYYGIGQKVFTKSGKYLGKTEDLLIDTTTFGIIKYYIKSFLKERIISSDLVIEIKPGKIIIKDDYEASRLSSIAETSPV